MTKCKEDLEESAPKRHWLFPEILNSLEERCCQEPPKSLKCTRRVNTGCLREVTGSSYCRYLGRWVHLSRAMEGDYRGRGLLSMSFHFPSQKPRAETGCQQRILFRDVCSRKFTEKAERLNGSKKTPQKTKLFMS